MAQRCRLLEVYLLPCEIIFKMPIYEGQGISRSSGLQERTAPSSKEVLAEKAKGSGNCDITQHSPKILETWLLTKGPHAEILQDGEKKKEKRHLDTTWAGMF